MQVTLEYNCLQVEVEDAAAQRPATEPPPALTSAAFHHLCLAHPVQVTPLQLACVTKASNGTCMSALSGLFDKGLARTSLDYSDNR